MADITEHSDKLVAEIKRRTALFVADNSPMNTGPGALPLAIIETAMLIGASIAGEMAMEEELKELLIDERMMAAAERTEQIRQQQSGHTL